MDKLDISKGIVKQNRTSTQLKKARLLKAMEKTLGVIQPACRMARVNRQTFYNWLKSDSQFKDDYQEVLEDSIDFAEMSLIQQIADGNTTAIIFFLSHKAKHRGWGLPSSQKANYNRNQKYSNDLESMSDEELMAIINKEYHIKVT
ncbi:hypothetical protein ACFO4P_06555 [Epilithonimonas pallida]|uniref:Homeodomain phBC6A51-type domain-containing protein n=1 Tax=Epilithonimonas pallida TaxID=373671 RepID=A0ABY1RA26_9FLAO|nr:hypothetical protein [Epilithonimonas pallida]SMP96583.1 hypothetical protein SAMN05421679_109127 [Epilithonimonas pallida]